MWNDGVVDACRVNPPAKRSGGSMITMAAGIDVTLEPYGRTRCNAHDALCCVNAARCGGVSVRSSVCTWALKRLFHSLP